MNNKIVAIMGASAALIGAIFAGPAHAVSQDVKVEIKVSPVLYMRTFETISLPITNQDFGTVDKDVNGSANKITNGDTLINRETPDAIGNGLTPGSVKKTIKELYAIWSNSANGVTVTVTPVVTKLTGPNGKTANLISATPTAVAPAPTLSKPGVGGAELTFDLPTTTAGTYTGATLRVEALPNL